MIRNKTYRNTVLFLLTGLFAAAIIAGCGSGDDPDVIVQFPDINLEIAISQTLGIPVGQITVLDLQFLFTLDASGVDITNLTGIEFCTNLYELYLSRNSISDLGPLAGLAKLTWLALDRNEISDISALADLNGLNYLFLSENRISELLPLSELTALTTLHLEGNLAADISPLADMAQMQNLLLNDNLISDLSPLQNLTQLRLLYLNDNPVTNIQPLAANTGLGAGDRVYLQGNALDAVSCSTYVPELESRDVVVLSDCP